VGESAKEVVRPGEAEQNVGDLRQLCEVLAAGDAQADLLQRIGDDVKVVAADGQSVLISQDGFDGDSVDIYTGHDEFHYKWARRANEIAEG
jgi:hypothetical protein